MPSAIRWKIFPWEGVLVDLALLAFWTWALPSATAWCLHWPHIAVWSLVLLQTLAVSRMVSLFMAGESPAFLGRLAPLGGLAAVLSAGGFLWLLGAMFASKIEWGFVTQRMPLVLVFTTLLALGVQMDSAEEVRTPIARARDAVLVVSYLFAGEAFLFAMADGASAGKRGGLILGLVLCHVPIRFVFASVAPTSRYELLSAAVSFGVVLNSLVG